MTKDNDKSSVKRIEPAFDFNTNGIDIGAIQNDANQHQQALIDIEKGSLNPFPVEAFPEAIQQIIHAANKGLNFPIDFLGASMLYTIGLCIGNTHRVKVTKGWTENAVLYIALVGRPGTNKSHPLSFALKPIETKDSQSYKEYEAQKQVYEQAITTNKKGGDQQDTEGLTKPVWQKFLVSDFTPEALKEVHKFNKRGIGVYVDELAAWFKNFNRYHKGAEQEFWLSIWNSKTINIDRKGCDPIYLPQPFIPVIGTIQTGILDQMTKDNRTENGFIDRILFAIPDKLEKRYWSETEIDSESIENWENIISNLLGLSFDLDENHTPDPKILEFTPEAWQVLKQWQKKNTDLSNNANNEALESIYAKLEQYTIRLALILELARWSCGEGDKQAVGIEAVNGALQLIEYFRKTAIKVGGIISDPLENYANDKHELFEALPDTFTTGEGLEIAKGQGMITRTAERFFTDRELFNKESMGNYSKNYQNGVVGTVGTVGQTDTTDTTDTHEPV